MTDAVSATEMRIGYKTGADEGRYSAWLLVLVAVAAAIPESPAFAGAEETAVVGEAAGIPESPTHKIAHRHKDARRLLVAGSVLTSVGAAFMAAGLVTYVLDTRETGTYQDDAGVGLLYLDFLLFTPGAANILTGVPLLIAGGVEKHQAKLLADGSGAAVVDGLVEGRIVDCVRSGWVLGSLSLAAMAGAWLGYAIGGSLESEQSIERGYDTFSVLRPASAILIGVAAPLMLGPYSRTRRALGLGAADALVVVGWITYALAIVTIPMGIGMFAFSPLSAGILVTSAALSMAAGKRALSNLEKSHASPQEAGPMVAPYAYGVPGGMIAGVSGVF